MSEDRRQMTENRRQITENRKQKTDGNSEPSGLLAESVIKVYMRIICFRTSVICRLSSDLLYET